MLNLQDGIVRVREIFGLVIFLTFLLRIHVLEFIVIFHVAIIFVDYGFFRDFSSQAIFVKFILTCGCAGFSFAGFALKSVNDRFHFYFQLSKFIFRNFLTKLFI